MADSPQHNVAGEVVTNKNADYNDITNVLHYMLVRLGRGVRNLHTPWLGLITCDMLVHNY